VITLNLTQGTEAWLIARKELFGASEAPAMMGDSKYMSRNELLKQKFTGKSKPVSAHTEEMARPIVEAKIDDELYPVTGQLEGSRIMASFDGLTMLEDVVFEHKLWNATLAENVRNGVLEANYFWQLEQQLLVSGAEKAIFVTSDGTEENFASMEYFSLPERRKTLIAGWAQFEKDLDNYKPEVKKEMVVAEKAESFPLITFDVAGTEITSNIQQVLIEITDRSHVEMNRKLETDQDFADKDKLNKATKQARADLKSLIDDVQGRFVSYSEFAGVAAEIDVILQKMQSHGEKQVTQAKQAKKTLIKVAAEKAVSDYSAEVDKLIDPIRINSIYTDGMPDFDLAMKGKRTIESSQNAVDSVIAQVKIDVGELKDKVLANLKTLRKLAVGYEALFMDTQQLITKENEDLIAVIKVRISEHETKEEEKRKTEREEIRIEEEKKATLKAENKVKGQGLVKSWQDALISAQKSDSIEFVEAKFKWISSETNCDEKIFTDNFDEALAAYDGCYTGISDHLTHLKKQAEQREQAKTAEVNQSHQEQEQTPNILIENEKAIEVNANECDAHVEQAPIKQRLTKTIANVPDESEPTDGQGPLTPKEKMNDQLRFWAKEYGVHGGMYSDLMNIINQYI